MDRDRPRCTTCLMPTTTTDITFDDHGTCSLCNELSAQPSLAPTRRHEGTLDQTIADLKRRGRGRRYDCLVGLSGGKDSVYLLSVLRRKHDLRCLAAYYRTPFTPQTIDDNVKRITSALDVDLVPIDLPQDYHAAVTSDFVKEWARTRDQIVVNMACAPCKILHRELYAIARDRGATTIVHGDNHYEHAHIAAGQFRSDRFDRYALSTNVLRLFMIGRRGAAALYKHPMAVKHLPLLFKASALYLNPYSAYFRLRYRDIDVLNYFDVGEWNEQECDAALDELGWELPAGLNTSKKADCSFAHLKNLMTAESAGADYFDCLFSNLVRYGVLDRAEGLERLRTEGAVPQEYVDDACRVMGVSFDSLGLRS